jgi:hypothetical protein
LDDGAFSTPFKSINPEDYITPSQSDGPANKDPPGVRKPVSFWKSPSRPTEPFYIASPSPATDMRTEDFVMHRRKREVFTDDDLEPVPHPVPSRGKARRPRGKKEIQGGEQGKGTEIEEEMEEIASDRRKKKGAGKWVRFLDVAITCPSDESDELSICKPLWTKKTTGQTSKQ